jgi:Na+/melibiose symporter-like transporter
MSFASSLTAIIAVYLYKQYFKHVSFKKVLVVGSILYTIFSFSAYALVTRINLTFKISDYIVSLFSSSTTNLLAELVMMPILSLACILCPKNLEATVYSVFMSAINLGAIFSYLEASFLTNYLDITSTKFKNLPKLIAIANITGLMPLVFLFFVNEKYWEPEEDKNKSDDKLTL